MESCHYARRIQPDDGLSAPYGGLLVQAFLDTSGRAALNELLPALPQIPVAAPEVLDLEMIAAGAYSPLTGFMTRAIYESVLTHAALPDGRPWGLPVTLAVSRDVALSIRAGDEVALVHDGAPVGVMRVDEMYPWEADAEARALDFSPGDTRFAARRARRASYLLGGPVAMLATREAGFMQHGHHWPLELRHHIVARGWRQVAVPHVRLPWLRTHEYLLKCALESSDGLLLHAPAEPDSATQVVPPQVLVAASRMLIENYFPLQRVTENPLPPDLLIPHPRAVLNHAIVSQNYGAGMLFVPDMNGEGPAHGLLAEAAQQGLGIRLVSMPKAFHCDACGGIATGKSCPHDEGRRVELSEDEVIEGLRFGEPLSPLAARPDIARSLARGMAERLEVATSGASRHIHPHASEVSRELRQTLAGHKACALWMTGLSGSGKSTIAHRLERDLLLSGHRVFVVDGDTLRHGLNRDLGFSEADRHENLRRAAELVKVMVEAGMIVIASFISPFRAERQMVREILGTTFQEVYVEASLSACEERDPKGLYKRARAGQIAHFTGISSPYEPPEHPEVALNTTVYSVEQCVQQLYEHLSDRALLRSAPSKSRTSPGTTVQGPMRIQ
jgi:sulfate adenylyltransferase